MVCDVEKFSRHPHGDDLLDIVWLKLGMQVAQKPEYLKARFGVQR